MQIRAIPFERTTVVFWPGQQHFSTPLQTTIMSHAMIFFFVIVSSKHQSFSIFLICQSQIVFRRFLEQKQKQKKVRITGFLKKVKKKTSPLFVVLLLDPSFNEEARRFCKNKQENSCSFRLFEKKEGSVHIEENCEANHCYCSSNSTIWDGSTLNGGWTAQFRTNCGTTTSFSSHSATFHVAFMPFGKAFQLLWFEIKELVDSSSINMDDRLNLRWKPPGLTRCRQGSFLVRLVGSSSDAPTYWNFSFSETWGWSLRFFLSTNKGCLEKIKAWT